VAREGAVRVLAGVRGRDAGRAALVELGLGRGGSLALAATTAARGLLTAVPDRRRLGLVVTGVGFDVVLGSLALGRGTTGGRPADVVGGRLVEGTSGIRVAPVVDGVAVADLGGVRGAAGRSVVTEVPRVVGVVGVGIAPGGGALGDGLVLDVVP